MEQSDTSMYVYKSTLLKTVQQILMRDFVVSSEVKCHVFYEPRCWNLCIITMIMWSPGMMCLS